jgi:hypothetical protein
VLRFARARGLRARHVDRAAVLPAKVLENTIRAWLDLPE